LSDIFYVYEHWRPDTGVCFYVGKGGAEGIKRAHEFRKNRNRFYLNIVAKLRQSGLSVDVRIIGDRMSETMALKFEVERIAHWRGIGVDLANITMGGDGVSGLKHSDETKQRLRDISKVLMPEIMADPAIRRKLSARQIERMSDPKNREALSILATERMCDPKERETRSAALIKYIEEHPEARTHRSISMIAHLSKPEAKKALIDALVEIGSRPEIKQARREAARNNWKDPAVRQSRADGIRIALARPEEKARRAEIMRQRMADPAYAAKMSESVKARWALYRERRASAVGA
jgi:hypothetical protein